ncbi:putative zinc [Phaeomoniella chlamydospora]|uniref:Putative zinc n=1 Tax=Phaeomoniella chlamydospora TaxID=158046 RepID=A0A0G2GGI1_PHACM|nr:putative zinc [Phaeomoniella chlamydospora]
MRSELDPLVREFQHENHRPRQAEALQILRKIASLVKPIMRQRNWYVGTLCEFYPPETNLLGLNINRGQKICLRLRYPGDQNQFLPVEQVTDTMLHELCHNVHGPHNEQFHALWNQLRDEHESLIRKGYTGEGFLSEGKRLGGSRIPMHEARRRAREAAERRKVLTAGSGQKLGGRAVLRGTDIRQVIADAAQRRITIERGCASGTDTGRKIAREVEENYNGFKTKAEEDDANERAIMQAYMDLVQEEEKEKYGNSYIPPSEENPAAQLPHFIKCRPHVLFTIHLYVIVLPSTIPSFHN